MTRRNFILRFFDPYDHGDWRYMRFITYVYHFWKRLKHFQWNLIGHNWGYSSWFPWPIWWKYKKMERVCGHYRFGYFLQHGKRCLDCNKKLKIEIE